MTSAHERKKQPEVVRQALIDCAAGLAVERGLHAVTVQAVADAAGVTKGGLFHHFPNKEKLIEAVFSDKLSAFERSLDVALAKDGTTYGCFTRAYVAATLEMGDRKNQFGALCVAMMMDPTFRQEWSTWLRARLAKHGKTDAFPALEIARYAADGVWLADVSELAPDLRMDRAKLMSRLVAMTKKP